MDSSEASLPNLAVHVPDFSKRFHFIVRQLSTLLNRDSRDPVGMRITQESYEITNFWLVLSN